MTIKISAINAPKKYGQYSLRKEAANGGWGGLAVGRVGEMVAEGVTVAEIVWDVEASAVLVERVSLGSGGG